MRSHDLPRRYGVDVVTIVNSSVVGNGEVVPMGGKQVVTNVGALKVTFWANPSKSTTSVRIESPDGYNVKVVNVGTASAQQMMQTGYLQNVLVNVPSEVCTDSGEYENTCATSLDGMVGSVTEQGGQVIFSAADMAMLEAECGSKPDTEVQCLPKPSDASNSFLTQAANMSYLDAQNACGQGCPCATEQAIQDCIFDHVEYAGTGKEALATASCADEYPCPDEVSAPSPPPTPVPILNDGVECWSPCGFKGGDCPDFCGAAGACCRKGWSSDGASCQDVGCEYNHCCSRAV